jgi:hypothetical protein
LGDTLHQKVALPEDTGGMKMLDLPVWTSVPQTQTVAVSLRGRPVVAGRELAAGASFLGLSAYRADLLPVQVRSLLPYRAGVTTDRGDTFLETHRQFVPGYRAYVNGVRTPVARSAAGMAVVPLRAGHNEVELVYHGTRAMRVAFTVSALSWFGLCVAAVCGGLRRIRRRFAPVELAETSRDETVAPRMAA